MYQSLDEAIRPLLLTCEDCFDIVLHVRGEDLFISIPATGRVIAMRRFAQLLRAAAC